MWIRRAWPWLRCIGFGDQGGPAAFVPPDSRASIEVQHQDAEFGVGSEFRYPDGLAPKDSLGIPGRMLPTPEPHYLGGGPMVVASS
jgi:hypothetical protein